jgi:branched-chain amino acid transport system permease protein
VRRVDPVLASNVVLGVIGALSLAICIFLLVDDSTKFLQLLAAGIALGAVYALVSLGFVVVYRATGILNFAQVGLVVFGAFFTNNAIVTWGWAFWPAAIASMLATAALAVFIERVAVRRMLRRPLFSTILLTIGVFLILQSLVSTIWPDFEGQVIASPWTGQHDFGSVSVLDIDIATIVVGALILLGFFALFRFTKVGLAMRATAIDPEAALAQGIRVSRIVALSWAIAGVVAVVAGTMLGSGAAPLRGGLSAAGIAQVALAAFPAMVLGGLDSPGGAVVGGLVIGVASLLAAGYQDQYLSALGTGFAAVLPYFIMLAILLIRPSGLFGTTQVRRI